MATSEKLNLGAGVQLSHEQPIEQSLIISAHGKPLSGKTYFAHTFSKYAPTEWPKERKSGKIQPVIFKDGASLSFDHKALAGLKERGFSVPEFDVPFHMANKAAWTKIGFKSRPTIHQVIEKGINALMQHDPRYIVIDTVSTFDAILEEYWSRNIPKTETGEEIGIQKFGRIKADHREFIKQTSETGVVLIWLFHSMVQTFIPNKNTEAKAAQKAKKETLQVAGGGMVEPAVTGGAAKDYKAAPSIQFALLADIKNDKGRNVYERYASPLLHRDHEAKNRWALSLNEKEPPHLGKIFAKITA